MSDNPAMTATKRVLYKPVPGVPSGGCHLDIYSPDKASQSGSGTPIGASRVSSASNRSPGRPADSLVATALFIHGGGFVWGASTDAPTAQVAYLVEQGYTVLSAEYRLAPQWVARSGL